MKRPLVAFYDDDRIGPDTIVLYSLRQAAAYLPYLEARGITADDLWHEVEAGRLPASRMIDGWTISIGALEAFIAAGAFAHRKPAPCGALTRDTKLFRLFALDAIGCVEPPFPMLPMLD